MANRPFSLMDHPEFTFTNQSKDAAVNLWNFGDDTYSGDYSPTHTYTDTGFWIVSLKIENKYGCMDSTKDTVRVRPMLNCFIPNALSPNGDHINDVFAPVCEGLEGFEMTIYNRWGQQIYHTKNSEPWSPFTEESRGIQEGVYVYTLLLRDYLGNPYYRKGTIVILR